MFLVMRVSYDRIGRSAFLIYAVLLVLLALLAADKYTERYAGFSIPGVHESRNIRGWIRLGPMQFQPSEFMKVALVLVLARYLRFRTSYRRLWGLVPPFLLTLVPMFLILLQPDLGTLLMLLPVLFAMIFAAGARLKHLAAIIVLGAATLPLFYLSMKDYQRARIDALFKQNTDDERWQMGPGYQLRQSKIALGTGRFWGEGVGGSPFVQRGLLPEEHNDFIFALVGHQWGFVGCLLVIAAYIVICICGLEVATLTNDPFGRLIAVGVVVMIVVQAMLNMSMVVGLAPITGIPLPMVSQGGSSLWANFIALGLLVDVARRRPMLIANKPFEHDD
jgi:cell division protein FtsW (lipid II flippase)